MRDSLQVSGLQVSDAIIKPLRQDYYRITGRIRDDGNFPVAGYIIQAFDKDRGIYPDPDDRLGKAETNEDGAFEIIFSKDAFEDWFEANPDIYLVVRGRDGKVLINTREMENATGIIDFQIKMNRSVINPFEPNLYEGNFARMVSALNAAFDLESLSGDDIKTVVEVLSRAAGSWLFYRDELARYAGYDGIQVPENPRREYHDHVTRWDKAVLPF
jgi:hypothetical protein